MRSIDAVLFDKTGTLTRGNHAVVGHPPSPATTPTTAAPRRAAEGDSEHPVARAIVAAGRNRVAAHRHRLHRADRRGVPADIDGRTSASAAPRCSVSSDIAAPDELTDATIAGANAATP